MTLSDQFRQQAIPKFKNVYLRLADLEQISREEAKEKTSTNKDGTTQGPSCGTVKYILASAEGGKATERDGPSKDAASAASYFCRMLEQELARIRRFAESFAEELWVRLGSVSEDAAKLQRFMQSANGSKHDDRLPTDRIDALIRDCNNMGGDIILLDEFLRQNVIAAAFVSQRHDSQLGMNNPRCPNSLPQIMPVYLQTMEKYLMDSIQYDPVLIGLSDTHCCLRQLRSDAINDDAVWNAPDKFQRKTTKFWVHPADVLRLKCEIIKHLPILIYGKEKNNFGPKSRLSSLKDQKITDWTLISSVYFDSEKLETYQERLRREHGASLVRVRWYGKRVCSGDEQLYVERKIHKDGWTGEKSVKERAPILAQEISRFIHGVHVPALDAEGGKGELLKDMQHRIISRSEEPLDRTEYRRIAFQESTTNEVRISLDTHVRIMRERGAPRAAGGWCRDLRFKIQPKDVVYFPYAVFELKLATEEPPDWVQDLLDSGMLVEVPKFSKFLHGTALLYGDSIRNSPFWFLPDGKDRWTPATLEEMADQHDKYAKEAAGFLFPTVKSSLRDRSKKALSSTPPPPLSPQKMQVSTLCSVQSNTTVLSEVVVLPSPEGDGQTHQVVHTSVQNSNGNLQRTQSSQLRNKLQVRVGGQDPADRKSTKDIPEGKTGKPGKNPSPDHLATDAPKKSSRAEALVRTRIEPKTFFANERTFLAWLTIAVMVMFMGLALLDGSGMSLAPGAVPGGKTRYCDGNSCLASKVSGGLICPIALILMIYALYMYRKRSIQILRRETVRYDDRRGPIILTILLVTVLVTAYVLSLKYNV